MQKPNKRLAGQTAIVTGANSGIGEAIAIALGRDGANVVVNYITHPEKAEEVAHKIGENDLGGQAIAIKCDVSKVDQVIDMFRQTIDHFGTVDICIPNAGLQKDSPLHEMKLEDMPIMQPRKEPFIC